MSLSRLQHLDPNAAIEPRLTRGQMFALLLLILAIWAATHRYTGIWHDGVLYAGQALHRLYPDRFVGDLFFVHGSQDSFSVFGPIYARLASAVGIDRASLIVTGVAHGAWLIALAMLARVVLRGAFFWVALLAIAALPRMYGAENVFAYAETFATARVLAEPLVLAGLACLGGGRRTAGNLLLLSAALFHPVMAFSGIAVAFAMQMPYRVILATTACALSAVPLLALGLFDIGERFQIMDALWYGISIERSPFVFFSRWQFAEFAQPAVCAAALFLVGAMSLGAARRFWFAVLYAGALGFVLAAMAERWPIALLVQMQPWRSAWLLQVCGVLAVVWVIPALWSRGPFARLMLVAMATCLFAGGDWGPFGGALLAVSYPALARWQLLVKLLGKHYRWFIAGFVVASLPEMLIMMWELLGTLRSVWIGAVLVFPDVSSVLVLDQPHNLWMTLGAASLLMILRAWNNPVTRVLACLAVSLTLFIAGLSWDALLRPGYRSLTPFEAPPAALSAAIPPGSLTYLEGGHGYLWFALGRPSYASHHQAAGVIFSRRTALEAQRRLNAVAQIGSLDARLQWRPPASEGIGNEELTSIPAQALVSVCQDPILDYVMLRRPLRGDPAVEPLTVISVVLHRGKTPVRLQIFECKRLRR